MATPRRKRGRPPKDGARRLSASEAAGLRALMVRTSTSARVLAPKVGCGHQHLSKALNRQRSLTPEHLLRLMAVLLDPVSTLTPLPHRCSSREDGGAPPDPHSSSRPSGAEIAHICPRGAGPRCAVGLDWLTVEFEMTSTKWLLEHLTELSFHERQSLAGTPRTRVGCALWRSRSRTRTGSQRSSYWRGAEQSSSPTGKVLRRGGRAGTSRRSGGASTWAA